MAPFGMGMMAKDAIGAFSTRSKAMGQRFDAPAAEAVQWLSLVLLPTALLAISAYALPFSTASEWTQWHTQVGGLARPIACSPCCEGDMSPFPPPAGF